MDEIKNIITKVVGDLAQKNPEKHNKIDRIWKNLLNKQELKHTKLTGIHQGTLTVVVDSPAWLYQMKIRQNKIVKQMKEEVPGVQHIRFKIGKIS